MTIIPQHIMTRAHASANVWGTCHVGHTIGNTEQAGGQWCETHDDPQDFRHYSELPVRWVATVKCGRFVELHAPNVTF